MRYVRPFVVRTVRRAMAAMAALTAVSAIPMALATDPLVRVATRPNLPPYVQDEATSGIEVDVIKAVFAEAGMPVDFVQMDRVEMIKRFERGEIEGTLTQNVSATSHGCATKWYLVHQNVGFSILSKNLSLQSLPELANFPVVSFHNAKAFLGPAFRSAVENNPRYQEVAPQSRHIGLLYNGNFDIIVGDEWIIRYVQRQHFEKTGEYQELRVHHIMSPTLYSARFQKQETCNVFNASLRKLRRTGEYDRIVDGYHQRLLVAAQAASSD